MQAQVLIRPTDPAPTLVLSKEYRYTVIGREAFPDTSVCYLTVLIYVLFVAFCCFLKSNLIPLLSVNISGRQNKTRADISNTDLAWWI